MTHIPKPDGRTYCGRLVAKVTCIDLRRDAIDDATCRTCQRSDDRRTREEYKKSDEFKKQRELERELEGP